MLINKEVESEVVKKSLIMNQEQFIKHFNGKGEKMISASDIYQVVKDDNKALIDSLVKDFNDRWIVTSSRLKYDNKGFAELIHDVDSVVVKPKSIIVDVPYIQGKVEYSKELEKYFQALFDTKDDYQTIVKVLKRFDKDKTLYLWTPFLENRKSTPIRSVLFYFSNDGFSVYCNDWIDNIYGLSRGVQLKSAKQTTKKSEVLK